MPTSRADQHDTNAPMVLSGPGPLLQAVPYLLGFHPQRSLVVVGLRDRQLVVTVRADLDDLDGEDGGPLEQTIAAMARGGARELIAAVYDDRMDIDEPGGRGPRIAELLDLAAVCSDCVVLDVLVVTGGRWRSARCVEAACCPPGGKPVPEDASQFRAAATYAGVVALPDRRTMRAMLDPAPDAQRAALEPHLAAADNATMRARLAGHEHRHEDALGKALLGCARASDEPGWPGIGTGPRGLRRVGLLAQALDAPRVRDRAWLAIDEGEIDGRALWREITCRAPHPYDVAPAFLYGWSAWRAGNGAQANTAVERALASDPGYAPAVLLARALGYGLNPYALPPLRDTLAG